MSFGILGLTLLAADVGDLIGAKAYEKAYAMTKPARLEGAAWIGFLYESELLDVVRFGRSAEGRSVTGCAGWPLAAAAQRDAVLRTELLGRALSCAQKGKGGGDRPARRATPEHRRTRPSAPGAGVS